LIETYKPLNSENNSSLPNEFLSFYCMIIRNELIEFFFIGEKKTLGSIQDIGKYNNINCKCSIGNVNHKKKVIIYSKVSGEFDLNSTRR